VRLVCMLTPKIVFDEGERLWGEASQRAKILKTPSEAAVGGTKSNKKGRRAAAGRGLGQRKRLAFRGLGGFAGEKNAGGVKGSEGENRKV